MTAKGWTAVSVKDSTHDKIKDFQVRAIIHTGRVLTLSAAIELAIEEAIKRMAENK